MAKKPTAKKPTSTLDEIKKKREQAAQEQRNEAERQRRNSQTIAESVKEEREFVMGLLPKLKEIAEALGMEATDRPGDVLQLSPPPLFAIVFGRQAVTFDHRTVNGVGPVVVSRYVKSNGLWQWQQGQNRSIQLAVLRGGDLAGVLEPELMWFAPTA